MMRIAGWILAGGVVMATASTADAQVAIQLGNPYGGGLSIGTGAYAYPYGYAAPVTSYYSSGYVAPGYVAPYPVYSTYGYRSAYRYPSYGYRSYGYGGRGYGYGGRGYGYGGRGYGFGGGRGFRFR